MILFYSELYWTVTLTMISKLLRIKEWYTSSNKWQQPTSAQFGLISEAGWKESTDSRGTVLRNTLQSTELWRIWKRPEWTPWSSVQFLDRKTTELEMNHQWKWCKAQNYEMSSGWYRIRKWIILVASTSTKKELFMQQNGLTIWESPQLAMKIKKKKGKKRKD